MTRGELALCYYKTPSSKEKSGWIFLSDVTSVTEENGEGDEGSSSGMSNVASTGLGNGYKWIHVCHPSRTYKLRCEDWNEQNLWMKTLRQICHTHLDRKKLPVELEKNQDGHESSSDLECTKGEKVLVSSVSIKKATKTKLQPASPTYEKERSHSNNEFDILSSAKRSSNGEKNHKAEIEFIRDITAGVNDGSKLKLKDVDDLPILDHKYHCHHDKLVQEREDNLLFDSGTPTYHEIITKSGIEQHSLYHVDSNNAKMVRDETGVSKGDGGESNTNLKHLYNPPCLSTNVRYETYLDEKDGRGDSWTSHSCLDVSSHDTGETIHKRIERAIKKSSNQQDKVSGSNVNEGNTNKSTSIIDKDIDAESKVNGRVVDTDSAMITKVEEFPQSDDDESQTSCFVTPKSRLPEDVEKLNHDEISPPLSRRGTSKETPSIGTVLFDRDVLTLHRNGHDHEEDEDLGCNGKMLNIEDTFQTPEKNFSMNDWDLEHEERYSGSKNKTNKNINESFDTDCSYRPDENFVEENWD